MRSWFGLLISVSLVSLVGACGFAEPPRAPEPDPCALPPGSGDLDDPTMRLVVKRSLACSDHRSGRISEETYRRRIAAIDRELDRRHHPADRKTPDPPDTMMVSWATSVIAYSTQYSADAWSAQRVLGPPDVFPDYGDRKNAWASHGADDRDEFIEVGFEVDDHVSGVEVYETFNPGAIDKIELIAKNGRHLDVPITGPAPNPGHSAHRVFEVRCTRERIASVRVHLDSKAVAGWNEIDAIGVVPCTR